MTIKEMLEGIKGATKSNAQFTWANAEFLAAQKVSPWSDMPVWVPPVETRRALPTSALSGHWRKV